MCRQSPTSVGNGLGNEPGLENGVTGYQQLGNSSTSGYILPQMYHRSYQGLYDNSNPIPLNPLRVANQAVSMETDNLSGYDNPQNPPHGYVGILDYPGSLPTNRAVSMATASVSGYSNPRSATHGYVGVRDYPYPFYLKLFPNRAVSMTTGSVSGYTNPNSLIYGYVGATDYPGPTPPPSKSFVKRTISRTSHNKSRCTPPQTPHNRTRMMATSQP